MNNDNRYILLLTGWYPSRLDHYSGDFVQRHAQSIALYERVILLFLAKDPSLAPHTVEVQQKDTGNLTEYIVYYSVKGWGFMEGAVSFLRYISLGLKTIGKIRGELGPPKLVHVCIPRKAGLLALFLKKKYGWQYLITEHWSGYSARDPHGLHTKSFLERAAYRQIYTGARLLLPVSKELAGQILRWFPGLPYEVVYNVADTQLFRYVPGSGDATAIKRCIHVSTMDYPKNIEGILRVVETLVATRDDVEIFLVGPYPPAVRRQLTESGLLDNKVFLTGLISYPEVAGFVRTSHLFFMFSRYENLPCSIVEALCCGVPVLATSVGGIPEIIDAANGMLVSPESEAELLRGFYTMLDNYASYDRERIAADASATFSYAVIGRRITAIYDRVLAG